MSVEFSSVRAFERSADVMVSAVKLFVIMNFYLRSIRCCFLPNCCGAAVESIALQVLIVPVESRCPVRNQSRLSKRLCSPASLVPS